MKNTVALLALLFCTTSALASNSATSLSDVNAMDPNFNGSAKKDLQLNHGACGGRAEGTTHRRANPRGATGASGVETARSNFSNSAS